MVLRCLWFWMKCVINKSICFSPHLFVPLEKTITTETCIRTFSSGVYKYFFIKSFFFMEPLNIKSTDIDTSNIDQAKFQIMRDTFPGRSDTDLARFYIARNGDVDLATEMLQAHLAWREQTPKPTKESCIGLLQRRFLYSHGYDKEG